MNNELKRIDEILSSHLQFQHATCVQVGNLGYTVSLNKGTPPSISSIDLYDVDDTIIPTSESKRKRQVLLTEYFQKEFPRMTPQHVEEVIRMTNDFSRWKNHHGQIVYHINAHIVALSWFEDLLRRKNPHTINAFIRDFQNTLRSITAKKNVKDSPLYFSESEHVELLIKEGMLDMSEPIRIIFEKVIFAPEPFPHVIDAILSSHSAHEQKYGVLTFGEPYIQLIKIVNIMKRHPEFTPSCLLLTTTEKGAYLEEMYRKGIYPCTEILKHITVYDDNPLEIDSLNEVTSRLKNLHNVELVAIESNEPGTKHFRNQV